MSILPNFAPYASLRAPLTHRWPSAIVRLTLISTLSILFSPVTLLAQRQLSWDALDVTASLHSDGTLDIVETQTMVLTGDWNGGERTFNLRPRQRLELVGVERIVPATGQRIELTRDGRLSDVDDYAMTDSRTLRWRSRLPSDPPFADTHITYAIHYRLSGILLKTDERYVLDHDFAFPDRVGDIRRFSLALTFDDGWKPLSEVRPLYSAGPIRPGESFVLTIPLRYDGTGSPAANDTRRPGIVVAGVSAILGALVLAIAGLLRRERQLGRLEPLQTTGIDTDWIRQQIVAHPPEVMGAAWDGSVGQDEVSALIARLVAEHKLSSEVTGTSMSLTLKVARSEFEGYERTLVDKLFFSKRTTTSTEDIKSHYAKKGFDPAATIQKDLLNEVAKLLPPGETSRARSRLSLLLFLGGAACLVWEHFTSELADPAPIVVGLLAVLAAVLGQIPGSVFRDRVHWGYKALVISLIAPILIALLAAWYLWYRVGAGAVEWSGWTIAGLTMLTCWFVNTAVNGFKSRLSRDTIAFRKRLAAGRLFFRQELANEHPALSDDWFPWVVAFGLTRQADRWSVRHTHAGDGPSSFGSRSSSGSSSSPSSSEPSWTGAAGGRSGGAGGGATWAAAMSGMAAGVSPPSSGGSSGGGSSSGGSSSGGSSGGGGGGGW